MVNDMLGRQFQISDNVARARSRSTSSGDIQISTVTRVDGDKVFLDNSKVPLNYPERVLIINGIFDVKSEEVPKLNVPQDTSVKERVHRIIHDTLDLVPGTQIFPSHVFSAAFGAKALDVFEIIMALEGEFNIEMDRDNFDTVSDLFEALALKGVQ
jgi:acyl carrier protein